MNTALIGLGMVADTHIRAIAATNGKVHLKTICSRDLTKVEAVADRYEELLGHKPDCVTSVEEIAQDEAIDFVIIATPPDARLEMTRLFAEAGKPILMEKPLERTLEAARDVVEICETADIPLGVVFQHRMRPVVAKMRDVVKNQPLGALAIAEIDVPWWRTQAYYDEPGRGSYARDGGGVLINQAIHILELALSFIGPVARVQAFARTSNLHEMEAEDFVSAGFELRSGAIGRLSATTAHAPGGAESITLHFEHAKLRFQAGQLVIDWHNGRSETLGAQSASGGGADPMAFSFARHQAIIEDFVDALEQSRAPCVTGREALGVHALIDALVRSSAEGKIVEL
jgi:predicted dehydrogenase